MIVDVEVALKTYLLRLARVWALPFPRRSCCDSNSQKNALRETSAQRNEERAMKEGDDYGRGSPV